MNTLRKSKLRLSRPTIGERSVGGDVNTLRKSKAIRRLRARREREAALKLDIERGKSYRSGLVDGVEGQPEYHVETVDGPQPRRIVTIGRQPRRPSIELSIEKEWETFRSIVRLVARRHVQSIGDISVQWWGWELDGSRVAPKEQGW